MLIQEVEVGVIVGVFLALVGGCGWLINRWVSRGDARNAADATEHLALELVRAQVSDFRDRLARIETTGQAVRDEVLVLGDAFHRHELWHERHDGLSPSGG